jgi:hypothetical protein
MKKSLMISLSILALAVAGGVSARAEDKEITVTGTGQCAKCALHESKSCQNAITVDENGKKVVYYLAQNKVSKDFHHNVCSDSAKVTATGKVKEVHGKLELTASKIELAK